MADTNRTPGAAERVSSYATPPSAVHGGTQSEAVVLDVNDSMPDVVRKLSERDASARGDEDLLGQAGRTWSELKAAIAYVKGDETLSEVGRAQRLRPAFEQAATEVQEMRAFADGLEALADEFTREVDDEDGLDMSTRDDADRQVMFNALSSGKMDKVVLGKKYLAACAKPKDQWTRQEGNMVAVVTRLHRSLGIDVVDPIFFEQGFGALASQSRRGPDIQANRERASMIRSMSNEIERAAARAAQEHGLGDAWQEALGLKPVDSRTKARWEHRR